MKRNLIYLTFFLAVFIIGCQVKQQTVPVKQYSYEQFANTKNIFGGSFSSDYSKVIISSNESGIFNCYSINLTDGKQVQLTDSKTNSINVISYFPNDERILFQSDQGGNELSNIFVRNIDGTITNLTPDTTASFNFDRWNNDYTAFYFTSNSRNKKYFDYYKMPIATMKPEIIYKNDDGFDVDLISKDEQTLVLSKQTTTNNSDIFLYDVKTKQKELITKHEGEVSNATACFDVENKKLYFLTDEGSEFKRVKSYELATKKIEEVEKADWDIEFFTFSKTGKYKIVGINQDSKTIIKLYDSNNKPVELPNIPDGNISSIRISKNEKLMVFYVNSSTSPNNLFFYDIDKKEVKKLTNTLSPDINENDLVKSEVTRFKSFDNLEIPAIVYKPKNLKEGEKAPAIIHVHGGPGGQAIVGYRAIIQFLVNHGYIVLDINNRGSSGYGKSFYKADDRKHGDVDLKDCIAAKNYLISNNLTENGKVGIVGGSYGGYMVLAALTYTPDEFSCGVDLFGVSNWLRTLKSIPPWWETFKVALYNEMGDPVKDSVALYKKSPLFHAKNIKKPLMVQQGANDPRVLKVESDEIIKEVKANNVPCEYVLFSDEGHGFVKKANQIKSNNAILEFLDKYLKNTKTSN